MTGRPPRPQARYPNRLREIRRRLGLSLEELATRVGSNAQTVQRYETGERQMKAHQLPVYADALGVQSEDLLPLVLVPVIGRVGAGARVFSEDHVLYQVRCPPGLDPARTKAVEVVGDSMQPVISEGWLLFFQRDPMGGVQGDAIGAMSIVETSEGETLVKVVRRGYELGSYVLLSTNAFARDDVPLRWAAPVRAMMPRDLVDPAINDAAA